MTDCVNIRTYKPSDLGALLRMFEAGNFDYELPDLDSGIFVSKTVLENGNGQVEMALLGRLTVEMYMLLDPTVGTPRERWEKFLKLHEAVEREMRVNGIHDVHAWIPPKIAKSFGRRLAGLGWIRDDAFTPYVKYIGGKEARR